MKKNAIISVILPFLALIGIGCSSTEQTAQQPQPNDDQVSTSTIANSTNENEFVETQQPSEVAQQTQSSNSAEPIQV
ncbi:MAG: hypothetical protein AAGF26_01320 [Cyanobacteria bacterium P01_G01_bin.49]